MRNRTICRSTGAFRSLNRVERPTIVSSKKHVVHFGEGLFPQQSAPSYCLAVIASEHFAYPLPIISEAPASGLNAFTEFLIPGAILLASVCILAAAWLFWDVSRLAVRGRADCKFVSSKRRGVKF
jgi:hypothetical protein